ncbi:MAG: translation factor Sua5, partial [Burkholderiales bacterium]|nr:translation factor Sua5 [Burkholderiales bacterium]
ARPGAASPRAPGLLASHYAPSAPLHLLDAAALRHRLQSRRNPAHGAAEVVGVYSRLAVAGGPGLSVRSMPAEAAAAAHELFSVLREFDATGVAAIWVERPPPDPSWDGVRDRLQRAAR